MSRLINTKEYRRLEKQALEKQVESFQEQLERFYEQRPN